jgi:CRISPR-associated protein Cmr5
MKTRSQEELEQAARLVGEVKERSLDVQKIYGGLCHSFPILVIQCGLAQAVAFHQSKESGGQGDRPMAHGLLLTHIANVLEVPAGELDTHLGNNNMDLTGYINATRRILSAWVFFKRFAVSILDVQTGEDTGDATR